MKELNDKELQNVAGGLFVKFSDDATDASKSGTSTSAAECLSIKKKDCEKKSNCTWNNVTGKCE